MNVNELLRMFDESDSQIKKYLKEIGVEVDLRQYISIPSSMSIEEKRNGLIDME